MLHIRCGTDILWKLDDAGLPGRKLSWSDPLCEGPVTGVDREALRAVRSAWFARQYGVAHDSDLRGLEQADQALAEATTADEVVLWFEADLFDQAILTYLLPRLADLRGPATRMTLVTLHDYPGMNRFIGLGQLNAAQLGELFQRRIDVTDAMVAAAQKGWAAWTYPTPERLADVAAADDSSMPYLGAAARRMLEELPDAQSGLSRTERQGLEAVTSTSSSLHAAFAASQDREARPWQGDSMFFDRMWKLTQAPAALLVANGGWPSLADGRRNPVLGLTELGGAVLEGRTDWWRGTTRERWVGGTRLGAGAPDWRWDRDEGELRLAS